MSSRPASACQPSRYAPLAGDVGQRREQREQNHRRIGGDEHVPDIDRLQQGQQRGRSGPSVSSCRRSSHHAPRRARRAAAPPAGAATRRRDRRAAAPPATSRPLAGDRSSHRPGARPRARNRLRRRSSAGPPRARNGNRRASSASASQRPSKRRRRRIRFMACARCAKVADALVQEMVAAGRGGVAGRLAAQFVASTRRR